MSRTTKRFLFPIVLFIALSVYLLPLFLITLVWSVVGAVNDHRLKNAGIPVDSTLFPSIGRTKQAIAADRAEAEALPEDLKKRRTKFRLIGGTLAVIGLVLACVGLYIIGTLLLIGGVALFISSTPDSYSQHVDGINLLECPPEFTLDRVYEDFREYKTAYGSVYRGTTFPHCPALFWKPAEGDWLYYFYKPQGKNLAYIGSGANVGCKQLSEPLYPADPQTAQDFQDALCWNIEHQYFAEDFSGVLRHYLKTGEILPMPAYRKGTVFFFEEDFKLTGQRFQLLNAAKEPVCRVEGTYPLKTLRVFDRDDSEVFQVTKELVHALPHYLFYARDELLGEFSKQFDLTRDAFTMQMAEGLLEMREINTLPGAAYTLTIDGRRIGTIAEKLNFTLENIVFDNMVLTVYEEKYLPLVTALGIMAVREKVRDENRD